MSTLKDLKITSILLIVFTLSFSCTKEEGTGGVSDIVGTVWVENYNADFTILNEEYWAEEEDVYLIYGSDSIYSDRFKTNYDGSYRFQYLREGDYKVYVYSKDSTFESQSGRIPLFEKIYVGGKDAVYKIPKITILN